MIYQRIKKWNLDWLEYASAYRTEESAEYPPDCLDGRLSTYLVM